MSTLKIHQLTVYTSRAHHTRLINKINCTIESGEILAVIGPNGAGKSTLINTIAGDFPYYQGEISLQKQADKATLRARQTAVLKQFSLLNFPYKVYEVVALGRIPHATGRKMDQLIIDQSLEAMDINFLKHRLYPELSGGEKQRVQLARVLAQIWRAEDAPNQTRLLLLDEPTTALDLGHQQQLMQAIKSFAQQGVAVMMALHDLNLAARYADQLLALLGGETIAYGSVGEVITTQTIDKLFDIKVEIMQHTNYPAPVIVGV